ncbi:DNA-processing protein DprA [Butyrivibrio proteoclasticus]|uniref:DNA-processing protein DprA n=1 Tax=Butyrivibrio proteoclasticus TaxID=43305 RepID=UPI0006884637|nr:DNA-processing protein DprA [Butyrivibrio proteoclasticus]
MITENQYAHWLLNVEGVGNRSAEKLLGSGLSCEEIFMLSDKDIRNLLPPKAAGNLIKSRYSWDFEAEKRKLEENNIRFIPRISEEYPEKLKAIPDSPFAIYVKGRLPDPTKPSVAIIGARMCSDYGRYVAREFGRGLALAGVQVISGMARGVDGISQKAAIEAGGSTFGILGCGVNICYPEENKDVYKTICDNGGLISEHAPDTMPKANFFPMRNRIISALADIVLVVEARQKSGTQITVDQALEQGKEILAVPGRVTDRLSDGCNFLISQGAGVAITCQDVLDRLWGRKEELEEKETTKEIYQTVKKSELGDEQSENSADSACDDDAMSIDLPPKTVEEEVLEVVDIIPISVSNIAEKLLTKGVVLTIPELMSKLMDLTYKGLIAQEGVYYRKRIR